MVYGVALLPHVPLVTLVMSLHELILAICTCYNMLWQSHCLQSASEGCSHVCLMQHACT